MSARQPTGEFDNIPHAPIQYALTAAGEGARQLDKQERAGRINDLSRQLGVAVGLPIETSALLSARSSLALALQYVERASSPDALVVGHMQHALSVLTDATQGAI